MNHPPPAPYLSRLRPCLDPACHRLPRPAPPHRATPPRDFAPDRLHAILSQVQALNHKPGCAHEPPLIPRCLTSSSSRLSPARGSRRTSWSLPWCVPEYHTTLELVVSPLDASLLNTEVGAQFWS
jgi:hypothetical protein